VRSRLFQKIWNSRGALYFRHVSGIRPPDYIPDFREVVSDLFVWRCDDTWETYFDLTHLAGILNPGVRHEYTALIVLFSADGTELTRTPITVSFSESRLIRLNNLPGAPTGHGTFSVLHMAPLDAVFSPERTCLVERGYVSYRRKSDESPLRSYVHGNLYGIAGNPLTGSLRTITQPAREVHEYQPQVRLDDCHHCEIALANYSPQLLSVEAIAMRDGAPEKRLHLSLPSRGSVVIDSRDFPLERIAVRARLPMPRPLLFKHYTSHFDVFHG